MLENDLPESYRVDFETYTSGNMTAAVAHFGEVFTPEVLASRVRAAGFTPLPDTGFDRLYRFPESDTAEQIDEKTMDVAVRLATTVMEARGWEPEEVDYLDYGSSVGKGDMAGQISEELGTSEALLTNAYLACNSAGALLHKRLADPDSRGKKTVLLAVDGVTELLRKFDPAMADIKSMQLFSNAGAAFAYISEEDISLLLGATKIIRDSDALKVRTPYQPELAQSERIVDEIVYEKGHTQMIATPLPDQGIFQMDDVKTALFFKKHTIETVAKGYEEYKAAFPDGHIEFVVSHHPGITVWNHVAKGLKRLGIDLPFEWLVNDGNSSGATSLIAAARKLPEMKDGQHGLYISFGAGGSFTHMFLKIGYPTDPSI